MKDSFDPPPGKKWVYTRYIRKKGKIIWPKRGLFFRFAVPIDS